MLYIDKGGQKESKEMAMVTRHSITLQLFWFLQL